MFRTGAATKVAAPVFYCPRAAARMSNFLRMATGVAQLV
jgi:hypothetical protein